MKRTPLRRTKGLNPISKKQRVKQSAWNKKVSAKRRELNFICQWCGRKGHDYNPELPYFLGGHHADVKRSHGGMNIEQEPYVCHNICHQFIDDHNIDVNQYPTKRAWEDGESI